MNRTQPTLGALSPLAMLVATLIASAVPSPAQAQRLTDAGVDRLAAATVYAGGVDFLPNVAYSGAKVTVAGPDMVYELSFGAGESLAVGMFDPDGQLLADGTYKWRLELSPTASAARELRRSAERNGGTAPDRWLAETGVFTIKNGQMVARDLVESRPARRGLPGMRAALPVDLAGPVAANRIADDTDEAIASGRAREERRAAPSRAFVPAGRVNTERSDAAALAAGPAPARRAAAIAEQPANRRSWPTDGKNGRD